MRRVFYTIGAKALLLTIGLSVCAGPARRGQASSSVVEIVTTYSQNGSFYLRSVPFDNEFPTLRGKTYVYATGGAAPIYVFDRGFDSVDAESNNLILSNDGEVIFYAIPSMANERQEGLKSITIYRRGKILKSFTETEVNGCDEKEERCSLLYSNYDAVVDRGKSNWGTRGYKKVFKEGVSEAEKFLSDVPVFSFDDTVYLTDSKKRVHIFDLREGAYVKSESFENIFGQIRDKGRFNRTELQRFEAPFFSEFPNLKDGRAAEASLADYIGMKPVDISKQADEQTATFPATGA
jgi:hypothetical protein